MSIQIIIKEVKNPSPLFHGASCLPLMKWKRKYCLVINLIEEIGEFFGVFLFLHISCRFISFYLFFFKAAINFLTITASEEGLFYYISFLLKNLFLILAILLASQSMSKKVIIPWSFYGNFLLVEQLHSIIFNLCCVASTGFTFGQRVDHPSLFKHYCSVWSNTSNNFKVNLNLMLHFVS